MVEQVKFAHSSQDLKNMSGVLGKINGPKTLQSAEKKYESILKSNIGKHSSLDKSTGALDGLSILYPIDDKAKTYKNQKQKIHFIQYAINGLKADDKGKIAADLNGDGNITQEEMMKYFNGFGAKPKAKPSLIAPPALTAGENKPAPIVAEPPKMVLIIPADALPAEKPIVPTAEISSFALDTKELKNLGNLFNKATNEDSLEALGRVAQKKLNNYTTGTPDDMKFKKSMSDDDLSMFVKAGQVMSVAGLIFDKSSKIQNPEEQSKFIQHAMSGVTGEMAADLNKDGKITSDELNKFMEM